MYDLPTLGIAPWGDPQSWKSQFLIKSVRILNTNRNDKKGLKQLDHVSRTAQIEKAWF
jgi:hypothetical protein